MLDYESSAPRKSRLKLNTVAVGIFIITTVAGGGFLSDLLREYVLYHGTVDYYRATQIANWWCPRLLIPSYGLGSMIACVGMRRCMKGMSLGLLALIGNLMGLVVCAAAAFS